MILVLLLKKKTRVNIKQRLSLWPKLTLDPNKKTTWIHAASVGELNGATPLVSKLGDVNIVITCTSLTGLKKAKELSKNSFLLPIDHPIFMIRVVSKVKPSLFLLFETELWPSLLYALKARQVPVVVVNGRISNYTYKSYLKFSPFYKSLLSSIKKVFTLTGLDQERFKKLGALDVQVSGSTKYDVVSTELKEDFVNQLSLKKDAPVFVAGSVRPVEDRMVLTAYKMALSKHSNLQLIIAPRHPERFEDVSRILDEMQIDYHKRSTGENVNSKSVILLDTLGELKQAYSLASFSFVGGTLVDIGGHNPMEAAEFFTPVILGPYTSNIEDVVETFVERNADLQVSSTEDLSEMVDKLISDEGFYLSISEGVRRAFLSQQGSSKMVLDYLGEFV